MPAFEGVGREMVMADAAEFYAALEADGFIVTGETEEALAAKDRGFTYGAARYEFLQGENLREIFGRFSANFARRATILYERQRE